MCLQLSSGHILVLSGFSFVTVVAAVVALVAAVVAAVVALVALVAFDDFRTACIELSGYILVYEQILDCRFFHSFLFFLYPCLSMLLFLLLLLL